MSSVKPRQTPAPSAPARGLDSPLGQLNWPLHGGFVVALAAFVALYASTFASLIYTWAHTGTFEYAFLIFPVTAMLVWIRREHLRVVTAVPARVGLLPVAALCVLWLAGALADINLVQHFCVIALVPALVYLFYGGQICRRLLFPLAYLFFALPFGNFLVGPLQDITAHLAVFALQATDLPVLMSGRIISTPVTNWHVAAACSGVKFFVATTAFGLLYANLFYQRLTRRVVFVACAMIVPVIANGLRVFFTILIGEYFGLKYATGTDHLIFGWQFFGTVLVLLFFAGWAWHEPEPAVVAPRGPRRTPPAEKAVALVTALAIAVLAVSPAWLWLARAASRPAAASPARALPAALGSASRIAPPSDRGRLGSLFAQADDRRVAFYNAGGVAVRLEYVRYDGLAYAGHELLAGTNRLYDSDRFQLLSRSSGPAGFSAVKIVANGARQPVLMWYSYGVNGRSGLSPAAVKAWQAWYALTGDNVRSTLLVLSTLAADTAAARRTLEKIAPAARRLVKPDRAPPR